VQHDAEHPSQALQHRPLLSPLLLQNGISMSCAFRLFLIRMALQCTPENIQQMMMALKASFGLVDNDRKQVLQAHVKTF
jgi:hypothetical protein